MIGQSQAFRFVEALIDKVARFDAPVLIEGETGTGKELAARAIHYRGARRSRPFVPVNCGALVDQLIENELFGHRRGAYTDARDDQQGLVELAHAGTLFLDEIDTLSPKGQVTLLRFLQDQQYRPVGGGHERKVDVRIIAAANRSLDQQVERGEFRLDLLHRLKLLPLHMPPLRERRGDIPLLAAHFVQIGSARYGKPVLPLESTTLAWFERYLWPGNVRELENLMLRELLLAEGPAISIPAPDTVHVPCVVATLNFKVAKSQAIADFESQFLAGLLKHTNGNVSAAARLSGTERRHLGRLLKKYQISKLRLQT